MPDSSMTPLFPEANVRVDIKQGEAGDCYLLATLDCLLNTELGFRDHIQHMFKVVEGGVELRIRKTNKSKFLHEKIKHGDHLLVKAGEGVPAKEKFKYRAEEDHDVFFITDERLAEIDKTSEVRSNSLAVKIFERIIPYYFEFIPSLIPYIPPHMLTLYGRSAPAPRPRRLSIDAHNVFDKPRYRGQTDSEFMADLLGIHSGVHRPVTNGDYLRVIKLKKIFPSMPVYVSLDYCTIDIFEIIHSRHAVRLDRIIDHPKKGYSFVMIDPWDNSTTLEKNIYSIAELNDQRPVFSIYAKDKNRYELIMLISELTHDEIEYLGQSPSLIGMLIDIKQKKPDLTIDELNYFIPIYKTNPEIYAQYMRASSEMQTGFIKRVITSKGSMDAATLLASSPIKLGSPITPVLVATEPPASPVKPELSTEEKIRYLLEQLAQIDRDKIKIPAIQTEIYDKIKRQLDAKSITDSLDTSALVLLKWGTDSVTSERLANVIARFNELYTEQKAHAPPLTDAITPVEASAGAGATVITSLAECAEGKTAQPLPPRVADDTICLAKERVMSLLELLATLNQIVFKAATKDLIVPKAEKEDCLIMNVPRLYNDLKKLTDEETDRERIEQFNKQIKEVIEPYRRALSASGESPTSDLERTIATVTGAMINSFTALSLGEPEELFTAKKAEFRALLVEINAQVSRLSISEAAVKRNS